MSINLSPSLISDIINDINTNRPVWAILRLLEYQADNPIITKILIKRAQAKVQQIYRNDKELLELVESLSKHELNKYKECNQYTNKQYPMLNFSNRSSFKNYKRRPIKKRI